MTVEAVLDGIEIKWLECHSKELFSQIVESCFQLFNFSGREADLLSVHFVAVDALQEPRLALAEIDPRYLRQVDELDNIVQLFTKRLSLQVWEIFIHWAKCWLTFFCFPCRHCLCVCYWRCKGNNKFFIAQIMIEESFRAGVISSCNNRADEEKER